MKKNICVYTCITGEYDSLKEIKNMESNIDYYCFTNNKNIKSKTWNVVYIEDDKLSNVLLARKVKILGNPIINSKYDIELWMDATVEFLKPINDFINEYLDKNSFFVAFKHGKRTSIEEEMNACLRFRKEAIDKIEKLKEFYKKENYNYDNGLIESTVFIRRTSNKIVWDTMNIWFDMVKKYTKRDQLSFNYAIFKTGMDVKWINKKVFSNDWFRCSIHSNVDLNRHYSIYYGDIDNYDSNNHYNYEYDIKNNIYIIEHTIQKDVDRLHIELIEIPLTKGKIQKIEAKNSCLYFLNALDYYDWKVFYNNMGAIVLYSNFKKGDKIRIEFEFEKLNEFENFELINNLVSKMVGFELAEKNIKEQFKEIDKKYNSIINSRSWKVTKPLRNIKTKIRRKK